MLRYGFNSVGHDEVVRRLTNQKRISKGGEPCVLGINLGKNKTSASAVQDYVKGVEKFGKFADYLTINLSSPNTPGLRSLQGRKELSALLKEVNGSNVSQLGPHTNSSQPTRPNGLQSPELWQTFIQRFIDILFYKKKFFASKYLPRYLL